MLIRVAAIDDHRVVLDGLAGWLADVPDLHIVATATTVPEYLRGQRADVVLLDLNLADRSNPADNVAQLVATGAKVMIVSALADPSLSSWVEAPAP